MFLLFLSPLLGWSLRSMQALDIHITKINDIRGGCNPEKVLTTKKFSTRKTGLINIYNNDNKCLLWCIAAALTRRKGWSFLKQEILRPTENM